MVLSNGGRGLESGSVNYNSGFLPAVYSGMPLSLGDEPILYLDRPSLMSGAQQRRDLDLLKRFNQYHAGRHPGDSEIRARTEAYELAARMQATVPGCSISRKKARRRVSSMVSMMRRRASTAPTSCARAGSWKTTCASCTSSPAWPMARRTGTRTTTCSRNHTKQSRMVDKPVGGVAHGPEAARAPRCDSRRVDLRVRSHLLRRIRIGSRSQSVGLHAVARRRWREGRRALRSDG